MDEIRKTAATLEPNLSKTDFYIIYFIIFKQCR